MILITKKPIELLRWKQILTIIVFNPQQTERIIHFMPGLQKATQNNSDVIFTNPLVRVIATDVQEYSLNKEGLYTFSLKLEEALP